MAFAEGVAVLKLEIVTAIGWHLAAGIKQVGFILITNHYITN